jgi:hypothetical protein
MTKVQPEHLSVPEIEQMIALYEFMFQEKEQKAKDAEAPYRQAEEIMRDAQENLKKYGGLWQEAKLDAERTEATLKKLQHLRHTTRGGMLFAEKEGSKPKRMWKANWVDDAVKVLRKEGRFMPVHEVVGLISLDHSGEPLNDKALHLCQERILAAAARPGNTSGPGRKKMLSLFEGHVGLQEWMMPSGRPAPKYLATAEK